MTPQRARSALETTARMYLSAADLDLLRRLWNRTGGSTRDFTDGSIEVLTPAGERITRGTPEHIETQLRLRLARFDPLALATT